jgi:ketosteroid isomerase-like protein
MSESQNVEIVNEIFAAFGRGDVPFMISKLEPDIHWFSYFDPIVPWGGDFSGKERVGEFFKAHDSVEVLGFEPTEFVAQGDTVVALGFFSCRAKSTGKSATSKWVFIFKFRNGLVYSYEQFHDPQLAGVFRP